MKEIELENNDSQLWYSSDEDGFCITTATKGEYGSGYYYLTPKEAEQLRDELTSFIDDN